MTEEMLTREEARARLEAALLDDFADSADRIVAAAVGEARRTGHPFDAEKFRAEIERISNAPALVKRLTRGAFCDA